MNDGLEKPACQVAQTSFVYVIIWFVVAIGPGMLEVCSSSWCTHSSME